MPCDSYANTEALREAQARALEKLRAELLAKRVAVVISAQGAVAFKGWKDGERGGLSDVCAYRKLLAANSPELRAAVMRAEALAGRKVDARQVAAGTHSHDGGTTWHGGH